MALGMDLHYPERIAARMPVVFYIHGGTWVKGHRRKGYLRKVYRMLRARGIIAGAVSYRLAPQTDIGGMIGDLKCAVRFMRAYATALHIAPDAIGAMGASAGGHLTAMLGVTDESAGFEGSGGYPDQSSRINAAVPVAPPLDLTRLDDFQQGSLDKAVAALGTSKRENELFSPYIHVSGDDPPFLIIQGDNDEKILTTEQAKRFHRKLVEAGVPSRLLIVGGADHHFGRYTTEMSMTRKQIWRTIANFFAKHL
jgi:acetyl esterase/lipase